MKQYNSEKAVIAMTSWKQRIATCNMSIASILHFNKGFHFVLTLSEEEFPTHDLPKELQAMVDNDTIEIIWVKGNAGPIKKIFYTMEKYPNVPIIIADDGNYYLSNHAEQLYNCWEKDKGSIYSTIVCAKYGLTWGVGGEGIIFPPGCFNPIGTLLAENEVIKRSNHDDILYGVLAYIQHIPWKWAGIRNRVFKDLPNSYRTSLQSKRAYNDEVYKSMFNEIYKMVHKEKESN